MNKTANTTPQLTPCLKLGYKVGDKFKLTEGVVTWNTGTKVVLKVDDGSSVPSFCLLEDPSRSLWLDLVLVEKLPPEQPEIHTDIKIKIENEEHYNEVMDILYGLGYHWQSKNHVEFAPSRKYIFAYKHGDEYFDAGSLTHAGASYDFQAHESVEYVLHEGILVRATSLATMAVDVDIEAYDNQIKTEGEKDMIKQNQTQASQTPKNKAKEKAQLVFTYTNGKKFVVRGLKHARVYTQEGFAWILYTNETTNEIRTQSSTVTVKVSNDLVTVEQINTDNSVDIVLDLRPNQSQEAPKKARGNARSKEEWEAIVAAKKAKEEAAAAAREEEAQALAQAAQKIAQQVYSLAINLKD